MSNILAFDQSYERTGIAVLNERQQLIDIGCIPFGSRLEPWQKRDIISQVCRIWCAKYDPIHVVIERVRLFSSYSSAQGKKKSGIALPTILALAKMNGCIVNAVQGLPVYSLDTKEWKTALFSRIPGKDMKDKATSVWYIEQIFHITVDHDAAEAACIGLASFNENLLKKET